MNADHSSSARPHAIADALRAHWPEYAIEAWALGTFMLIACGVATLLGHESSPVRAWLGGGIASRCVAGFAMGATAVALITSPWGRRSGAHLNPAVTLTFARLGRVRGIDAAFYVLAQCIGGAAGVGVAHGVLGELVAAPSVRYAITVPGPAGIGAAFLGEAIIAFTMMAMVLLTQRHERTARFAPALAGLCVWAFITLESPLSGMSMNPARTAASALHAGEWTAAWLYVAAPLLGMALAALAFGRRAPGCAKLMHCPRVRCIFCGREPCPSERAASHDPMLPVASRPRT